jgi:hypothetical protein
VPRGARSAPRSPDQRPELGGQLQERDIEDLLTLYGVSEESERESLLALAREANRQGWWHSYDDVLAQWFQTYIGLEEAANLVRTYEVQFVPGLMQTEDYARAVTVTGRPKAAGDEVERRVGLRIARQRILTRPSPPALWAGVDEASLRRPTGGRYPQLSRLLELTERPTSPRR